MQKDNNTQFKYAIALTGGIATGKSTVASLFMLHGFLTIDADKVAHKLLDENYKWISDTFGKKYIENNKVIRKKLGELIFNNEIEKKRLESFLHPLIKQKIIEEANIFETQKKPYLIDIPLFFENNNYNISKSIVVYTPKEIQLQRLTNRDKSTKGEALVRINNQMNIEDKKKLASFIIDNSLDLKKLQKEVDRVKKELLNYV
ncbi:MAG: dephospho-CoA kinase [Campylobacterota bacterium]|nr:dephospho-CoA kinase [Campylobacterota bacterium]